MTRTKLIFLIAATLLVDQLTKVAALSLLSRGMAVPVFPGFNLALGFNEGASFGMMGGVMAGKPLLMAALTGALTLMFFTYAFVNMGMVSGILPVVGVPLPFVSYGGTALVTLCLGVGMLMSIQRHRRRVGT